MVGMLPDPKDNFYDRLHRSMILPSSIVEFYPDPTLIVDRKGRVVVWNRAMVALTGIPAEDMLGKGNYEYAMPFYGERRPMLVDLVGRSREEVGDRYENVIIQGDRLEAQAIHARVRGREVVLWGSASRLYALNGKPVGAIESIRDVTYQKAIENKLRESEEKYRLIATSTNDGLMTMDLDGTITYVNPKGREMLARPDRLMEGHHFSEFVADEYQALTRSAFYRGISGEAIAPFEIEVIEGNGRRLPVELSGGGLHSREGRSGAIIAFRDVSERWKAREDLKKAHEELERRVEERASELVRSEEKFRVLAETAQYGIFIFQDDRYVYVNSAAARITGFTKGEILAMEFWRLVHPDYQDLVRRSAYDRLAGDRVPDRYEVKFVTRSGEERWAELMPGVIQYNGKPAILVSTIDVTDRKRIEEALTSAKESAEMYLDLMGHDINNMNQIALGYQEMAQDTMSGDSPALEYLERSSAMLRESSRLIDNVRKIQQARGKKLRLEVVDLGPLLVDVAREYAAVPGRDVAIEYLPVPCRVRANRLLKDVFSNIIGNAIKHSEGPLRIAIRIKPCETRGEAFHQVWIEDDGTGIADDLKEAIFTRSRRGETKANGHGLGLYLVKSLVESFGGRVWVEDRVPGEPGRGSRFVVLLPAMD